MKKIFAKKLENNRRALAPCHVQRHCPCITVQCVMSPINNERPSPLAHRRHIFYHPHRDASSLNGRRDSIADAGGITNALRLQIYSLDQPLASWLTDWLTCWPPAVSDRLVSGYHGNCRSESCAAIAPLCSICCGFVTQQTHCSTTDPLQIEHLQQIHNELGSMS